jgi:CheY-like chemotaxis protein
MSSSSAGSSTNVLVVEDEMVLRMRAVDIVEDAGFNAVEAVNADEALSILENRSDISLLFSDIQMPGSMDGLKLATRCMTVGLPSGSFWCLARSRCPRPTSPPTAASLASRWR